MRYFRFLPFLLLLFVSGCAHSAPVTLQWTNPVLNAVVGSCASSPTDTLRDLSRVEVYGRAPAQADSTLIITRNLAGREGLGETITFNQPEGTYTYWLYLFDTSNNKSCKSPTATKSVILSPSTATDIR